MWILNLLHDPVIAAIGGAAIAIVSPLGPKVWDQRNQRTALRGAFRAEIAGLMEIAAVRGHEQFANSILQRWRFPGSTDRVQDGSP